MKKYFTLTSLIFYATVTLVILVCVWTSSKEVITIKAASPTGEQVKPTETATPTVSPTPTKAKLMPTVGNSPTSTLSPTVTRSKTREANRVGEVPKGAVGEPNEITVKRQICSVFKSDCDPALEVARCESNFNPKAKNKQLGSTASGLFEIVRETWKLYKCEGDPFNIHDNAVCAKKIYDRNHGKFNTGGGWEASHVCHKQD